MDPTDAIVAAFRQYLGADTFGNVLVFVLAPLGVHVQIQAMKAARAASNLPKLSPWAVRLVATLATFILALFFGYRMAEWPIDKALNNAVVIAVFYPIAVFAILRAVKAKDPQIAAQLGADSDLTELQLADKTEPPAKG